MGGLIIILVVYMLASVSAHGPHHPRASSVHRHQHANSDISALHPDKEHIKEDLKNVVFDGVTDKMSPEELDFYYFKIHDADNNTMLDGLEILHAVEHNSHDEKGLLKQPENLESIVDLIDGVLAEDDTNKDGYLSYVEYVLGREREEANAHTSSTTKIT